MSYAVRLASSNICKRRNIVHLAIVSDCKVKKSLIRDYTENVIRTVIISYIMRLFEM
jgi:hypothetical protein